MSVETQKKAKVSQIVKLDNALKLAQKWVSNMSASVDNKLDEVEPQAWPERAGLGAKVSRQSNKRGPSNNPLERKLYAKLNSGKRKASKIAEESVASCRDEDDDDEDSESRTSAFSKKRAVPLPSSLKAKKR